MRELILDAAVRAAETYTYNRITKEQVAEKAGVAPANVQYYFKTIQELRDAIVKRAIGVGCLAVMAQAMGMRNITFARDATLDQKRDVLKWVAEYYRL